MIPITEKQKEANKVKEKGRHYEIYWLDDDGKRHEPNGYNRRLGQIRVRRVYTR